MIASIVSASAAVKMPLKAGTYVLSPYKCSDLNKRLSLPEHAVLELHDDSYEIWETSCSWKNLKLNGKKLKFKTFCSSEGEAWADTEEWEIMGTEKLKRGDGTYNRC